MLTTGPFMKFLFVLELDEVAKIDIGASLVLRSLWGFQTTANGLIEKLVVRIVIRIVLSIPAGNQNSSDMRQ
jgi:hypothetical protein